MIPLIRKYLTDTQAAIVSEFSLSFVVYFTLLMILLDLMLIIAQWADVQRTQAMVVEMIKNRNTAIITSNITNDNVVNIRNMFKKYLIFYDKADTMAINIMTTNNDAVELRHISGVGDAQYRITSGTNFVCNGSSDSVIFKNTIVSALIRTRFKPYRISVVAGINNSIFGDTIYATSFVTLTGL